MLDPSKTGRFRRYAITLLNGVIANFVKVAPEILDSDSDDITKRKLLQTLLLQGYRTKDGSIKSLNDLETVITQAYFHGRRNGYQRTNYTRSDSQNTSEYISGMFEGMQKNGIPENHQKHIDNNISKWRLFVDSVVTELINDLLSIQYTENARPSIRSGFGQTNPRQRKVRQQSTKKVYVNVSTTKAKKRLRVGSNTSISRAQADGVLDEYASQGIEYVTALVEFRNSPASPKVCPICLSLNGVRFRVEESYGVIPVHPNCYCTFVPVGNKRLRQRKKDVTAISRMWTLRDEDDF